MSRGHHHSEAAVSKESPANLGSYLGQLAAANHVRKLVERYLTLAPVFIGGPSNTSLEIPTTAWRPIASSLQREEADLAKGMTSLLQRNGHHDGLLPKVDIGDKLNHFLDPAAVEDQEASRTRHASVPTAAGLPNPGDQASSRSHGATPAAMFNPALYSAPGPPVVNPMQATAAEQQSRLYSHLYDRMRAVQQSMAMAAAQQQQHQQVHPKQPQQLQQQPQQQQATRAKRRRTSAGTESAAPSHLSGEMIRRLREKQKMKNAAAVASVVANVAAVTTSGGRQFDPTPTTASAPISPASSSNTTSQQQTTSSTIVEDVLLKPPPLMSRRDTTSAELEETTINGQIIPCFNIGGEMRLCLPQIIQQILGDFHWEQICLACEELQIHVAPASTQQLVVLKGAGVLPIAAHQCGLITKSDAERLASFLTTNKMPFQQSLSPKAAADPQLMIESPPTSAVVIAAGGGGNKSAPEQEHEHEVNDSLAETDSKDCGIIHVQHECFGKATGTLYPRLYRNPSSKCISCSICNTMLDPQSFVRHLHSERENRTCHWGFDASHWRSYVHLSDVYYKKSKDDIRNGKISPAASSTDTEAEADQRASPERAQVFLDDVKRRFRSNRKLTRKQVSPDCNCPAD